MKKKYLFTFLLSIASLTLSGCFFKSSGKVLSGNVEIKQTYLDLNHNSFSIINCLPSIGSPNVLVIPVWFKNDSPTYIKNDIYKQYVWNDINTCFFGSSSDCGYRSIRTYFEDMSLNKFKLQGTVSNWYEIDDSVSLYYSESGTTSGSNKTAELVIKATDWYFSNTGDSKSKYDLDKDGYFDSVILIYAAPDYTQMPNYESHDYYNMWAYTFWEQKKNKNKDTPIANAYMWASYDFMYGLTTVLDRTGSKYCYGDTSHCNLDTHTYIHEFGHLLGLMDYYDYAKSYTDMQGRKRGFSPTGGFIMQDNNVGSYDPYSVLALGWATPYIVSKEETLTLGDFQSGHDLILLTPGFNSSQSAFDEYFLLELYTPTGLNDFDSKYNYLNAGITGTRDVGIRLWHVDARLTNSELTTDLFSDVNNPLGVGHAMSNTYNDSKYGSLLGKDYYNYNILQLIRNNKSISYQPTKLFSGNDLFKAGDKFDMNSYSYQFYKSSKLNSGKNLGWSFKVDSISSLQSKATISFYKD